MWTTKEIVIFFAGAEAFHTISHLVIGYTHILPTKVWGITWDQKLNRIAIIANAVITAALLLYATRL